VTTWIIDDTENTSHEDFEIHCTSTFLIPVKQWKEEGNYS